MIAKMPAAEAAKTTKTDFSRRVSRMLGLDLHSWEQLMLLSLGAAGLVAIAVFVTTAAVIILQRHEVARTKLEFDAYKLTVEGQVADAKKEGIEAGKTAGNALVRAAELEKQSAELKAANLALEAQIAPRSISADKQRAIVDAWKQFRGKEVSLISYAQDAEGARLANQIKSCLDEAGIKVVDNTAGVTVIGGFSLGVHINGRDGAFVNGLRIALGDIGGVLSITGGLPAGSPPGFIGIGPQVTADATVLVGVKPIAK